MKVSTHSASMVNGTPLSRASSLPHVGIVCMHMEVARQFGRHRWQASIELAPAAGAASVLMLASYRRGVFGDVSDMSRRLSLGNGVDRLWGSLQIQRWGVAARLLRHNCRRLTAAPQVLVYGGCARDTFGYAECLRSVREPAYSCHPSFCVAAIRGVDQFLRSKK